MTSSSSSSSSISDQPDGSNSKTPIIILDSDDSDNDDVQIIEVRSVRKKQRSEGDASPDRTSSSATDAEIQIHPSLEPKWELEEIPKRRPKEMLKRELEEPTSPIPGRKRQRTDSEESRKAQIAEGLFDEDDLPPYTRRFFIDLADAIAITFPISTFAMQHDCSPGEVSRAISAVIVSPLLDPSLHELVQDGESSIEDYGRMMIEIWRDRYRRMVGGEDDVDSERTMTNNIIRHLERQKYIAASPTYPVDDPPKSIALDKKPTASSLSSSETVSVSKGSPQHTPFPKFEKSAVSTERHWVERDAFGIYVESESAPTHPTSVEAGRETMFGAGMNDRGRVKSGDTTVKKPGAALMQDEVSSLTTESKGIEDEKGGLPGLFPFSDA